MADTRSGTRGPVPIALGSATSGTGSFFVVYLLVTFSQQVTR